MLESLISSKVRARLLVEFFLSPGVEHSAWALSASLKETYSAVWKELRRLEKLGVLSSRMLGNARVFQVNSTCPIAPELRSIVLKTAGVGGMIQQRLHAIGEVRSAFIYGSFASGKADERSDIDLMLIGDVNLDELSEMVTQIERELNRPINYTTYTTTEWQEKLERQDPFALNVQESDKIVLVGGEDGV